MALQRITGPGDPVPYYKKKGFIGPVLPDSLEYMEGMASQPLQTIPITRKPIAFNSTLMENRVPVVDRMAPVIGKRRSDKFRKIVEGAKEGADTLLPFANNIINAFRTPPPVPMPNMDSPVTLQKVNMDNDRFEVEKGVRAANASAYRNLDENTATAASGYNLAQRFNQLSAVNQSERNQNTAISNQEVMTNAGIKSSNNSKLDQRDLNIVERKLAMQRENSQNFANAVDKKIMIDNEKSKANLDLKRFGILMKAYNRDGVAGREFSSLSEMQADPIGAKYIRNKAGETEAEILKKANEEYQARTAERKKKWKEDTNAYLVNKKKYGGSMKYSAGGMIKTIQLQKI